MLNVVNWAFLEVSTCSFSCSTTKNMDVGTGLVFITSPSQIGMFIGEFVIAF